MTFAGIGDANPSAVVAGVDVAAAGVPVITRAEEAPDEEGAGEEGAILGGAV